MASNNVEFNLSANIDDALKAVEALKKKVDEISNTTIFSDSSVKNAENSMKAIAKTAEESLDLTNVIEYNKKKLQELNSSFNDSVNALDNLKQFRDENFGKLTLGLARRADGSPVGLETIDAEIEAAQESIDIAEKEILRITKIMRAEEDRRIKEEKAKQAEASKAKLAEEKKLADEKKRIAAKEAEDKKIADAKLADAQKELNRKALDEQKLQAKQSADELTRFKDKINQTINSSFGEEDFSKSTTIARVTKKFNALKKEAESLRLPDNASRDKAINDQLARLTSTYEKVTGKYTTAAQVRVVREQEAKKLAEETAKEQEKQLKIQQQQEKAEQALVNKGLEELRAKQSKRQADLDSIAAAKEIAKAKQDEQYALQAEKDAEEQASRAREKSLADAKAAFEEQQRIANLQAEEEKRREQEKQAEYDLVEAAIRQRKLKEEQKASELESLAIYREELKARQSEQTAAQELRDAEEQDKRRRSAMAADAIAAFTEQRDLEEQQRKSREQSAKEEAENLEKLQKAEQEAHEKRLRNIATVFDVIKRGFNTVNQTFNETLRSFNNGYKTLKSSYTQLMSILGLDEYNSNINTVLKNSLTTYAGLYESVNLLDQMYEKDISTMLNWAENSSKAYGIANQSAREYLGQLSGMLSNLGIQNEDILETMSINYVKMAGDLASAFNKTSEQAFLAIRSGIAGISRPLEQFGINLKIEALDAWVQSNEKIQKQFGGIKYRQLSEYNKQMVRYAYILEKAQESQGDFAKTSSSFSNEIKTLKNEWTNLLELIGKYAVPVFKPVVEWIIKAIAYLQEFIKMLAQTFGWQIDLTQDTVHFYDNETQAIEDTTDAQEDLNKEIKKGLKLADLYDLYTLDFGDDKDSAGSNEDDIKKQQKLLEGLADDYRDLEFKTDIVVDKTKIAKAIAELIKFKTKALNILDQIKIGDISLKSLLEDAVKKLQEDPLDLAVDVFGLFLSGRAISKSIGGLSSFISEIAADPSKLKSPSLTTRLAGIGVALVGLIVSGMAGANWGKMLSDAVHGENINQVDIVSGIAESLAGILGTTAAGFMMFGPWGALVGAIAGVLVQAVSAAISYNDAEIYKAGIPVEKFWTNIFEALSSGDISFSEYFADELDLTSLPESIKSDLDSIKRAIDTKKTSLGRIDLGSLIDSGDFETYEDVINRYTELNSEAMQSVLYEEDTYNATAMQTNLKNLRSDLGLTQDELDKTIDRFEKMNNLTSDKMALEYGKLRRKEALGVLTDTERLALDEYNKRMSKDLFKENELLNLSTYGEFVEELNKNYEAQYEAISRSYADLQSRAVIMAADTSNVFSKEERDAVADQIAYYEKMTEILDTEYKRLGDTALSKFKSEVVSRATEAFSYDILSEDVNAALDAWNKDKANSATQARLRKSISRYLSFIPDTVADVTSSISKMNTEELNNALATYNISDKTINTLPDSLVSLVNNWPELLNSELSDKIKNLFEGTKYSIDFKKIMLQTAENAAKFNISEFFTFSPGQLEISGPAARSTVVKDNIESLAKASFGEDAVASYSDGEIIITYPIAVEPTLSKTIRNIDKQSSSSISKIMKSRGKDAKLEELATDNAKTYMSEYFRTLDPDSSEYASKYEEVLNKERKKLSQEYKESGTLSSKDYIYAFLDDFNSSNDILNAIKEHADDTKYIFGMLGNDGYYSYKSAFELASAVNPIEFRASIDASEDEELYAKGFTDGSKYISGINKALASEGIDASTFSSFLANSQSYVAYFAKQERDAINQILDDNQKGIIQALQNFNFSELTSIFGGDANLALRTAATSVSTNAKLENIKNNNQYAGTRLSSYLSDTESGINIENKVYIGDTEIRDFITETLIDNNLVTG